MNATQHQCSTHIHYIIPEDNDQKASEYATFIARECRLRGIPVRMDEDAEDWRELLQVCVASESKLALLYMMHKWKNDGILKVPLVHYVELLIPCIFHLENRAGEKIITMILRRGLELWPGPKKE